MSPITEHNPAPDPDLQQVLDRLRAALPAALAGHDVVAAYAYGSLVRRKMTPFSDIDVALVLGESPDSYERLMVELSVQEALEQATGLSPVDVRVINEAPLDARGRIIQDGTLLYERDRRSRVAFEVELRKRYFDFAPVAHRLREAFLDRVQERGLVHG